MEKNIIRIITILITIFLIFAFVPGIHNSVSAKTGSEIVADYNGAKSRKGRTFAKKILGPVISALRIIAIGIGLIMIVYLGTQYIMAAPSEKAEIKNKLMPLIVGIVLVTASTAVLTMIKKTIDGGIN